MLGKKYDPTKKLKKKEIPNYPGRIKRNGKVWDFTGVTGVRGGQYKYKYSDGEEKRIWVSIGTANRQIA